MADKNRVKAALIQHPPVFLNFSKSLEKAKDLIREAAENGVKIIVFPETWLPGYPIWLDHAENAALWNHSGAKALYRLLSENAVQLESPEMAQLENMAEKCRVSIVMGAHEKKGGTLYNTMLFFPDNGSGYKIHRKLTPTYNEKMVWGNGDGSTLATVETDVGVIGGLICWEHWMPLARAAMHAKKEQIHVAQWPSVTDLHQVASRHYAFEGNCFVLACGSVLTKDGIIKGFDSLCVDEPAARTMLESVADDDGCTLMSGGSCVIGPDACFLNEPVFGRETIVYAELDLNRISESHLVMDTDGHYSRPDIFSLTVDTALKKNVIFRQQGS